MKVAAYYLSAALLLGLLASGLPIWLAWIGWWSAASCLAVSLAYALNRPQIFRKRQGRIPRSIRWLFMPVLVMAALYNRWARRRDPLPPLQQIEPGLWLGSRLGQGDRQWLEQAQIEAILDVTAEFDALDWSSSGLQIDYLNIPILDHSVPTPSQCTQALNWLHRQHQQGKRVLVHCALGRGRSALILAAYLLAKSGQEDEQQVLARLQQTRTSVRLNGRQWRCLGLLKRRGLLRLRHRACLIANPVAGGGKWQHIGPALIAQIQPYLQLDVRLTSPEQSAFELAKQARQEGFPLVIAAGGDGTLNEVASALTDSEVRLGIVPLGTANALCHQLWGWQSKLDPLQQACASLLSGQVARIDTARCNGRLVLLLVGIGLEQGMIAAADRSSKDAKGQLAYVQGLWQALLQQQSLSLQLCMDNHQQCLLHTSSLVIANAAPATTVLAQGHGRPDLADGKLDLTWLSPSTHPGQQLLTLADLMRAGLADQPAQVKGVEHCQAREVWIKADHPIDYVIDGEPYQDDSLHIRVQPASLQVLVPPPAA